MAWQISGQYMESCNCDYLCPCIYTNPQGKATHDHCTALLVFRIDEGQADGVDLAGGKFALVFKTGPVMADGNWVYGAVVDGKDDQVAALEKIAGGEAGGTPGMIRANLVSDYRGVQRAKIGITVDGHKRAVDIPGVLSFAVQGVAPRNRPDGEPMAIDNTAHPANRRLALAQASQMTLSAFGVSESLQGAGNNGHFAPFSWKS
jgi:hypothetical protein